MKKQPSYNKENFEAVIGLIIILIIAGLIENFTW